jgi:acetylornithine deacetylase/succinyl-diaminopimelate desuccinylase-like protein
MKVDRSYMRSLLESMVRIDTSNGKENDLVSFLYEEFEALGLSPIIQEVCPNRSNIYAIQDWSSSSSSPFYTFNFHLDTVPVCQGWATDPWEPFYDQQNDLILGLGAADQKAGIASSLAAFKALQESDLKLNGKLALAGVIDEEGYSQGARALLKTPISQSDGILISEPFHGNSEDDCLPIAQTGKILIKVKAKGRSAHAFTPEKGINALDALMVFYKKLLSSDYFDGDTVLGFGNRSLLDFGWDKPDAYSVSVPDNAYLTLTRLTVRSEDEDHFSDLLSSVVAEAEAETKASFSFSFPAPKYNAFVLSEETDLIKHIKEAYRQETSVDPFFGVRTTITDANVFTAEGNIPTLSIGPLGGNLHAPDEWVSLPSTYETARIYARFSLNVFSDSSANIEISEK